MQDVKQQAGSSTSGAIIPAVKVESLKMRKRKRVFSVVKQESILSATTPAMQAFLQLADDVRKV